MAQMSSVRASPPFDPSALPCVPSPPPSSLLHITRRNRGISPLLFHPRSTCTHTEHKKRGSEGKFSTSLSRLRGESSSPSFPPPPKNPQEEEEEEEDTPDCRPRLRRDSLPQHTKERRRERSAPKRWDLPPPSLSRLCSSGDRLESSPSTFVIPNPLDPSLRRKATDPGYVRRDPSYLLYLPTQGARRRREFESIG